MAFLVLDELVCGENILFIFVLAFVTQILYTKLHNVQIIWVLFVFLIELHHCLNN
jgi:hypothetical protein